jgi:chitinase
MGQYRVYLTGTCGPALFRSIVPEVSEDDAKGARRVSTANQRPVRDHESVPKLFVSMAEEHPDKIRTSRAATWS